MMWQHIVSKLHTLETITKAIHVWKLTDRKIVFTNGCFDILHYGHIHYLAQAKALGDKLIVGINSDNSVRRLKGQHRPINDNLTRKFLLASLQFVDVVIEFEEDTPIQLIQTIQPDVLTKGGDWQVNTIVGADVVMASGGVIKSLPFVEGYSTTNIEQKILSRTHTNHE
jgi:rfaE bifunctional protein nucleotidyltransferase chain/domain